MHKSGNVDVTLCLRVRHPSSCTLTSIDQRRARGACSERHVFKGTHSGAEGCRRVVGEGGGGSEGTAKSDGTLRRRQTVSI